MTQLASFCAEENYFNTVPSASVMVWPLKLMVPLLVRLVRVQSPVRVHVEPFSMVTTALFSTAVPPAPSGLSGGVPSRALMEVPPALSDELAVDVLDEHAARETISAAAQVRDAMRFVASLIKNLLPMALV